MRVNLLNMNGELVASKLINTIDEADAFFTEVVEAVEIPLIPVVELVEVV